VQQVVSPYQSCIDGMLLVEDDIHIINKLVQHSNIKNAASDKITTAIRSLNKGKSADYHGLAIEHIIYAGSDMEKLLVALVGCIFKHGNLAISIRTARLNSFFACFFSLSIMLFLSLGFPWSFHTLYFCLVVFIDNRISGVHTFNFGLALHVVFADEVRVAVSNNIMLREKKTSEKRIQTYSTN
jgi:hypothetical protein